jgi:hypothetical protein
MDCKNLPERAMKARLRNCAAKLQLEIEAKKAEEQDAENQLRDVATLQQKNKQLQQKNAQLQQKNAQLAYNNKQLSDENTNMWDHMETGYEDWVAPLEEKLRLLTSTQEQNSELQEQVRKLEDNLYLKTRFCEVKDRKIEELQQKYAQLLEAANKHCEQHQHVHEEWAALTQQLTREHSAQL